VNNKNRGVAKPIDNLMVGAIPIFMAKNIGINNFTSLSSGALCCPVLHMEEYYDSLRGSEKRYEVTLGQQG